MSQPAAPARYSFRPKILVKFRDSTRLPYTDGAERGFRGEDRKHWKRLSEANGGLRLLRVFRSVRPQVVASLVQRSMGMRPAYVPPNFLTYFHIEQDDEAKRARLVRDLLVWQLVERAYTQLEPPPPPTVDYENNPDSALQTHLDDAPNGVGVRHVWAAGADGSDVVIVDIEKGWDLPHSDLPEVEEIKPGTTTSVVHGTRTLGVLAALDNSEGGVGLAPRATLCVAGESVGEETSEREDAMMAAIARLSFGDVMLLEMQHGPEPRMPVEMDPALRDLMELATALGIVVVEPAANGGVSLDGSLEKDTGAIRVAAAYDPNQTSDVSKKWIRYPTSNYGSGIHCFAQGYMVATTEPGSKSVSMSFKETSAASAIVAGAAAALQSWYEKNHGYRISPLDLRALFTTYATPHSLLDQDGNEHVPIGVMPDLAAIIEAGTAVASALLIRDTLTDDGTAPSGTYGWSPDIAVSGSPLSPGAFADTSKVPVTTPVLGESMWVYVRVHNRSSVAIENVVVDLHSIPVGLALPVRGLQVLPGRAPSIDVGAWVKTTHRASIAVGTVPAGGHSVGATVLASSACHLMALARTADSPAPSLSTISGLIRWKQFVTANPNVASRQVFRLGLDDLRFRPFPIGPVPHGRWDLIVTSTMPPEFAVELELPPYLVEQILDSLPKDLPPPKLPIPGPRPVRSAIPILPGRPVRIGLLRAPVGEVVHAALRVAGEGPIDREAIIDLQWVHEGVEISRMVFEVERPLR